MAVLDRYVGELQALQTQTAVDGLANPPSHDAYGLGVLVGRQEGLRLAAGLLDKVLSETEADERGSGRHRSKT